MYIRVKKNANDSFTVVLAKSEHQPGKKYPRYVLVKTLGTTKDLKVVEQLKVEAEKYKKSLTLTNPKASFLRINDSSDIDSSKITNCGFHDIYGVLFDQLVKNFGIRSHRQIELLKNISILRIAEPTSKHRAAQICAKYGYNFKVDSIYKLMDKLDDEVIGSMKKAITNKSKELLKTNGLELDVIFYDLTTIYFETNSKDDLRQFGFSKDGKSQHVQITLGLLVSREGLPIGYEIFPGNIYEGHTLERTLDQLSKQYGINNVVVVADSGLISNANIELLQSKGYGYIIAARVKNLSDDVLRQVKDRSKYTRISIAGISTQRIENYKPNQTLFCYHSEKKQRKDEKERQEKYNKLIKQVGKGAKSIVASKYSQPYLKIEGAGKIVIDEKEMQKQEALDGLFCIASNKSDFNANLILEQYKGLWHIERAFRSMKSEISIRPVYHWTVRRMKAHFVICYIAFALSKYLHFKLQKKGCTISGKEIHSALKACTGNELSVHKKQFKIYQDLPDDTKLIYKIMRKALPDQFTVL